MQEGKEVETMKFEPVKVGEVYLPYPMRCVVAPCGFVGHTKTGIFDAETEAKSSGTIALFLHYARHMALACGMIPRRAEPTDLIWLPTSIRHEMTPAAIFHADRKELDRLGREDRVYIVSQHNVLWHGAFGAGYSAEENDSVSLLDNGVWLNGHRVMLQTPHKERY